MGFNFYRVWEGKNSVKYQNKKTPLHLNSDAWFYLATLCSPDSSFCCTLKSVTCTGNTSLGFKIIPREVPIFIARVEKNAVEWRRTL